MHTIIIIDKIFIEASEESRILLILLVVIMKLKIGKWDFAVGLYKLHLILTNERGSGSQNSESWQHSVGSKIS